MSLSSILKRPVQGFFWKCSSTCKLPDYERLVRKFAHQGLMDFGVTDSQAQRCAQVLCCVLKRRAGPVSKDL